MWHLGNVHAHATDLSELKIPADGGCDQVKTISTIPPMHSPMATFIVLVLEFMSVSDVFSLSPLFWN
jgi:hypothetical protein